MTISSQTRKAGPFVGNDSTTAFPFAFKVFSAADMYVVKTDTDLEVETVLVLNTDYTVSLNADQNANPGGTITLPTALATGFTLTVTSNISPLQQTDLTNQGGFYPSVITNALDKLTILIQQALDSISRSLKLPVSTPSGVSTTLPLPSSNKLIGWNQDADGLQNVDPTTLATIVAFGTANADVFDGDGATTQFNLTANPGALNNLDVSIGGVTQTPGIDYTWTSGTVITFTSAPPLGTDNVLVRYMQGLPQGTTDATLVTASDSAAGSLWTNVQGFINRVLSSAGSAAIGFIQSGTGAQVTTLQEQVRIVVNVFQFMTPAQIADVKANTAASNLASALDVTAAIQAAINYAATRASVGGVVYFPPGSYKITSTLYSYGSGAVGQVALVGSGRFSTRFFPSGDFTAINLVSSYVDSGDFSVEWPLTASASIPAARVGVEFAGADWQVSYMTARNITVMYAYRGFVLNDWTGQPLGTMYLCKLFGLTAFRCANWGFYLNSKTGSTTLVMELCYARGDSSAGGQYGKGFYINNFNDVQLITPAIDQCLNDWLQITNGNIATITNIALESNKMSSAASVAIDFNATSVGVYGLKLIANTLDTGGNARILYMSGNCYNLTLQGFNEQGNTVVAGTTRYKVAFNAAASNLYVTDGSVTPADVLDNGWFANAVYQGVRRTGSAAIAPNYGTWARGDVVKNGSPSVGATKGWVCTASGSPGTWVSEGNL